MIFLIIKIKSDRERQLDTVVERKNHTIYKFVRSMLLEYNLPKNLRINTGTGRLYFK